MRKLFIESREFTAWVRRFVDDATYAVFQQQLMERPDAGVVIPGSGGLRKVRIADPRRQKGKRGGARVIYLHMPEVDWIFLVDIYSKDEQDDLSASEKKVLRQLAHDFKKQAIQKTAASRIDSL